MPISFSHPNIPTDLVLRLSPTMVEWTFNLNYRKENTYGGQVVQILSINYDRLIIEGQFGKEGPHGKIKQNDGTLTGRSVDSFWDFRTGLDNPFSFTTGIALNPHSGPNLYAIGLTQMTAYFQEYFAIASQGRDRALAGHYDQEPVTVSYDGGLDSFERNWTVYPVDFPSYSRSLEEFAPKWRLEFEVEEADYTINDATIQKAIDDINNLRANVGYTPYWVFSDPLGQQMLDKGITAASQFNALERSYDDIASHVFDHFNEFLPYYTAEDYAHLIFTGASIPNLYADETSILSQKAAFQAQSPGITTDPTQPVKPINPNRIRGGQQQ